MYNFDGVATTDLEGLNAGPSRGCFVKKAQCDELEKGGGGDNSSSTDFDDCDVTLYVVWTGTDVDGKVFQSAGNRFSAFPPNRLQAAIDIPDLGIVNPF